MARTPPAALDVREQPYGWVMVAVTFLLSVLTFGGLPAVAVFIKPLTLEFGWTRGETSLGYT
ncbi:MAG: MFS transporter, partial [Rhodospirillaceae bacterium]|nr:MFS transporter [Rhodospirillaceae bacterium]